MIDLIKKYIEKRFKLVKLDTVGAVADVASTLVTSALLLVFGLFVLLMFNFALALWIGEVFKSLSLGFVFVGFLNTLFIIIYLLVGKKRVEMGVKDQIVKSAFSSEKKWVKSKKIS